MPPGIVLDGAEHDAKMEKPSDAKRFQARVALGTISLIAAVAANPVSSQRWE